MTINTVNCVINELYDEFINFADMPDLRIPYIEDIKAPGVHLWIFVDQNKEVIVAGGNISCDDREDITNGIIATKLYCLLQKSNLPFQVGIEISHLKNEINVEVIVGKGKKAMVIRKNDN